MKSIEAIISSLRVAMTDARQNESHFESWMILNEAICDAIDALAEQPAQQQEPVAWATRMGEYAHIHWGAKRPEYPMVYEVPLYTSPPASKPLTDEQIMEMYNEPRSDAEMIEFARSIEAAHGITGDQA